MPIDHRQELTSLRGRHGVLVAAHEEMLRETARLASDARYWAVAGALQLKRANILLAASARSKSGAVAPIASHAMWVKETRACSRSCCSDGTLTTRASS